MKVSRESLFRRKYNTIHITFEAEKPLDYRINWIFNQNFISRLSFSVLIFRCTAPIVAGYGTSAI